MVKVGLNIVKGWHAVSRAQLHRLHVYSIPYYHCYMVQPSSSVFSVNTQTSAVHPSNSNTAAVSVAVLKTWRRRAVPRSHAQLTYSGVTYRGHVLLCYVFSCVLVVAIHLSL